MSKIEIEVKILEIDKDDIIKKLNSLGAIKVFDEYMDAIYYKKDGTIDINNALRLRREGDKSILTYKKKYNDSNLSKSFFEDEVVVEDFDKMHYILLNLGFDVYNQNRKHRISYKIGSTRFEIDDYLDKYHHIPVFLEIEVSDENHIKEYFDKLDLNNKNIENFNFFELIKYYENH